MLETIEAQDSSPVTITIGDNVTALANTNITIQCQASGAPKPSVTWSKDNKKLSSGDRYTVQVDGSLLLIIGTRIEDSARYTCTAESVAGTDSASSKVQVVGEEITLVKTQFSFMVARPHPSSFCTFINSEKANEMKQKYI